ncbi:MAG: SIMPL domain-containing protein [Candidatus Aenigmarchaeota archaeon]|nr:SIMPL domain-containing protein [Candidatus Aenigmarchaeota archaeon]
MEILKSMPAAIIIASLVLGLSFAFSGTGSSYANSGTMKSILSSEPRPGIVVSGTGTLYADPDMTDIFFGIEAESLSASDAQQKNADVAKKVMDALLAKGLAKDKIETTSYNLQTVTEYDEFNRKYVTKGYKASHMLKVTLDGTGKAGEIIDAVSQAGANRIDSVQFRLNDENQKQLNMQALGIATKQAREKAQSIAGAAGVGLGKLTQASESYVSSPIFYQKTYDAAAPAAAGTEIATGQLQVTASVSLTYEVG